MLERCFETGIWNPGHRAAFLQLSTTDILYLTIQLLLGVFLQHHYPLPSKCHKWQSPLPSSSLMTIKNVLKKKKMSSDPEKQLRRGKLDLVENHWSRGIFSSREPPQDTEGFHSHYYIRFGTLQTYADVLTAEVYSLCTRKQKSFHISSRVSFVKPSASYSTTPLGDKHTHTHTYRKNPHQN